MVNFNPSPKTRFVNGHKPTQEMKVKMSISHKLII